MSGIAGLRLTDERFVDDELLKLIAGRLAHRGPDGEGLHRDGGVGLVHRALWTTPEAVVERQPRTRGHLTIVADLRLDNREELFEALGVARADRAGIGDAELALRCFEAWGEDCPTRLIGDFALAVWDAGRRRLFAARDPMGVKSLIYWAEDGRWAFGSEIKALLAVPGVPCELDELRLAEFIVQAIEDTSRTFYRGIRRLAPGSCLVLEGKRERTWSYWRFELHEELRLRSDAEYAERFREVFTEAVRCRLRCSSTLGSALSGGLDSSSISALAGRLLAARGDPPLQTFSAIFPSVPQDRLRRIDEREYAQAVAEGPGIEANPVRADQIGPLTELESVLWHQDEPVLTPTLYMHWALYGAARERGVRVFLDGLDGDSTVSHGFERLSEAARSLRWLSLWREARSLSRRFPNRSYPTARLVKEYGLLPLVPEALLRLRERARGGPRSPRLPWREPGLIQPDFAKRVGLKEHLADLRRRTASGGVGRAAHLSSIRSPLLVHGMDVTDKASAAFGLEARYPFMDRRLITFCLSLPSSQKLKDGWTRFVLRSAMEGILPSSVQWRNSKADLSANVFTVRAHERECLERVIGQARSQLEPYLDVEALVGRMRAYAAAPSASDLFAVYAGSALVLWCSSFAERARQGGRIPDRSAFRAPARSV